MSSAAATTDASTPVEAKPRILLVDDEKDIVSVFSYGLRKHGLEVDGFSDPREALHILQPLRYSLAILDVRMPHMSG
ncbi:MAG TPA: response regulator, partial [Nitrososphaera sp.]|nr:response regulator [Nitrososphaera sp.]